MSDTESIAKLAEALSKAQGEFKAVPKNKTAKVKMKSGGEYEYYYADLADILAMALPILSRHGIVFSQPLKLIDGKLRVITRLRLGDEIDQSDGIALSENLTAQEFGSDLTYFRRYDACSLLGIAPDEDKDGALTSGDKKRAKPSTKSPNEQERKAPTPINGAGDLISEQNRKRIYALAYQANVGHEDIKQFIRERFNVDSTTKITTGMVPEIEGWLQVVKKAESIEVE